MTLKAKKNVACVLASWPAVYFLCMGLWTWWQTQSIEYSQPYWLFAAIWGSVVAAVMIYAETLKQGEMWWRDEVRPDKRQLERLKRTLDEQQTDTMTGPSRPTVITQQNAASGKWSREVSSQPVTPEVVPQPPPAPPQQG
jgi:hypothetical protein